MPPPAFTRNATGRRRRHVVRRTQYLLRSEGLNARKQWQSHLYQQMRAAALIRFGQTLGWLSSCAVVYMINASNDVVDPNMLLSLLLGSSLLELYARHADMYTILDAILCDIPDNEDRTVHWGPPRHRRIADFDTDDNARSLTRFTKTQLYDILHLLALPHFVAVRRGRVGLRVYNFHREELLIFLLTKIVTGEANVHLCQMYFGGPADRWSYGYPWFLRYVDNRFYRVHTTQGLCRWVRYFPNLAAAIAQHVGTHVARLDWTGPTLYEDCDSRRPIIFESLVCRRVFEGDMHSGNWTRW